ncbi:HNH endonuclease [Bacteroidota bacterium]
MNNFLLKYIQYFSKLRRASPKDLGKAPHKPILLLSIIQLIKSGSINSNRIFITPELVLAFKSNWKLLVETNHTPNFALPFFHMRSEPFWRLVCKPGMQLSITKSKSIKSFKTLNDAIAFAEIDKALFELLSDPKNNFIVEEILIKNYFNTSSLQLTEIPQLQLEIEYQILNDDRETYSTKIKNLQENLDESSFQEEIFVRGGIFKKTIPEIYNQQCCISEMKIQSSINAQMIDACHIVPFSISHNDTVQNGISLSPNLHRAYDRGLITINKDYIVRVSPTVIDNDSVYSISQFNGKQIALPNDLKNYPSPESLEWHTKEVFQL